MIRITAIDGGVRFAVKAVPGASRDALAGEYAGAVKVRVSRPAERGKANDALCKLLAAALGVRKNAVRIVSGHTSPVKAVEVRGVTVAEAAARLSAHR